MAGQVLFERDGPVGCIVLNRPAKLNALDAPMLEQLGAIVREATYDPSLRVLTITGSGTAFCAGADLAAVDGPERASFLDLLADTMAGLGSFPKPLVGALNGTTAAAGLEIALRCDLLLAVAGARIADAHILHGLVPGAGSATLLPFRIGESRARQMLFTGEFETAEVLHQWGLLNWVCPPGELAERTRAIATRLAIASPEAVLSLKATLNDPARAPRLAREHAAMRAHLDSDAARAGLKRFRKDSRHGQR